MKHCSITPLFSFSVAPTGKTPVLHPRLCAGFAIVCILFLSPSLDAATKFAWSGNAGWIDFAPSADIQVQAGPGYLEGYAYATNFGWIHFGDGSPANGTEYSNSSGADFGVNHSGTGELSGLAYSGNIGWINFSWATPNNPLRPRIDLVTGQASGYAYAANVGWINLENLTMPGVTARITTTNNSPDAGQDITLELRVFGHEVLQFAWFRDGQPVPGATDPRYDLPSAQLFHAGAYQVRVTRADGTTFESDPLDVAVTTPPPSGARLLNLSTRGRSLGGDNILIPGFFVAGNDNKQLLIRTVGPRLVPFGVTDALADPQMTLQRDENGGFVNIAANDDWRDGNDVPTLLARSDAVGAFSLEDSTKDSVLDESAQPGRYTVTAEGVGGTQGVALVEVYDADDATTDSRLTNLSIRAFTGTGDDIIIPGFVISEEGPLNLLIRAAGPKLADFGVPGVLEDPRIAIFGDAGLLFENDDWEDIDNGASVSSAGATVGAFEFDPGSRDAAIVATLAPGRYTVQVSGADGGTGVALFELYELP